MISFDCEQNNHNSFSSITMIPGKSLPFGRLFALYGEGARPVMGAASFLGSLCEGAVKRQGRLTEGVAAGRARYRSGSKPGATPSVTLRVPPPYSARKARLPAGTRVFRPEGEARKGVGPYDAIRRRVMRAVRRCQIVGDADTATVNCPLSTAKKPRLSGGAFAV